jgi:CRISPR-associated endonuclease/helicase Cas3
VQALFEAYVAGRKEFSRACGTPGISRDVCCAWFDEYGAFQADHSQSEQFNADHETFVSKRIQRLEKETKVLRLATLLPITSPSTQVEDIISTMAETIHTKIFELHQRHLEHHPQNNKTVSIGLVRMANINPMVALAKTLLSMNPPDNYHLHFCVYHSQYPLLVRSNMEAVLDKALNRNNQDDLWKNPIIVAALKKHPEDHHVFLVMGTSVTEVGRDHDYDWAIAEPSSMRSLIQLAGRIQRHRRQPPATPNLLILNKNVKALKGEDIAYTRPGFESKDFNLTSKDLTEILHVDQYKHINAVPRILPRNTLDPQQNLVDLEHAHLHAKLFGHPNMPRNASLWWKHNPGWCYELQRQTPFRQSHKEEHFILQLEDENEAASFYLVTPQKELIGPQNERFKQEDLEQGKRVTPWVDVNPEQLIIDQAEKEDMELTQCSQRFAVLHLSAEKNWHYHPLLGVYNDL